MSNKIKKELNKIEIPKELHERSKKGVLQAKSEQRQKRRLPLKGLVAAASLVLAIGIFVIYNNSNQDLSTSNEGGPVVTEDGSVEIPMIELPDDNSSADMIGLIVYKGKIYTQTRTEIDVEAGKALLGEKLGTTKATIDEWSDQEAYDQEFASTIGVSDVYAVKGYDRDFRIMTYEQNQVTFYENLNGITVSSGEDVFGKLKIAGNIKDVEYRIYSDWNNSIENYHPIENSEVVSDFIDSLYQAQPLLRNRDEPLNEETRNNEEFRELTIHLEDGTRVSLMLLKGGYIYYGVMPVYFQMDQVAFGEMWELIGS
ncbi:hypothetical protein GCM10011351_07360 [Paraliobacillus quinghaiensis]|uniref:Uncharacterized protein n=1 Tax=Paraliobacillus quinghaiensis TaxID=470815 RepID=A0A917TI17_9BACI|nr:hypothetical protein [Paraliobacillus quinghaiensis]GGM24148.1 hypothetical protein GCM10011351_07360 [Paraliobacillus quinghaiensis]